MELLDLIQETLLDIRGRRFKKTEEKSKLQALLNGLQENLS